MLSPLLEKNLINAAGEQVPAEHLQDYPYTLLYFSAAWCPPCQLFTPRLKAFYEAQGADRAVEVIFVSGDRSAEAMAGYMADKAMPWPAISWGDPLIATLQKDLGGPAIPALVLLDQADRVLLHSGMDPNGSIDPNAQKTIGVDGVLRMYDYVQKTTAEKVVAQAAASDADHALFKAVFPQQLQRADGTVLPVAQLDQHDYIAVYFSASWCGPCHVFTPQLVSFYEQHGGGKNFEVILVSSDRSAEDLAAYRTDKQMPGLLRLERGRINVLSTALRRHRHGTSSKRPPRHHRRAKL